MENNFLEGPAEFRRKISDNILKSYNIREEEAANEIELEKGESEEGQKED